MSLASDSAAAGGGSSNLARRLSPLAEVNTGRSATLSKYSLARSVKALASACKSSSAMSNDDSRAPAFSLRASVNSNSRMNFHQSYHIDLSDRSELVTIVVNADLGGVVARPSGRAHRTPELSLTVGLLPRPGVREAVLIRKSTACCAHPSDV